MASLAALHLFRDIPPWGGTDWMTPGLGSSPGRGASPPFLPPFYPSHTSFFFNLLVSTLLLIPPPFFFQFFPLAGSPSPLFSLIPFFVSVFYNSPVLGRFSQIWWISWFASHFGCIPQLDSAGPLTSWECFIHCLVVIVIRSKWVNRVILRKLLLLGIQTALSHDPFLSHVCYADRITKGNVALHYCYGT